MSFPSSGRTIHVLGFAGSLRRNSYNRAALRAASEGLPEGITMDIFDLAPIPLYNEDLEKEAFPAAVTDFKARIADADALLIASPEYNYSIPGVLKNALDWASRPPGQSPLPGKPVAVMGASTGYFGTARCQYHLRQVFVILRMLPLVTPEVFIPQAQSKFDPDGRLTDEQTRQHIQSLLVALRDWTIRLQGPDR
ncbi:MAG TPA: NAD(P)H-dependent oxidoreductase [Spirochaetia bacterium]|nr:NAD(P)H-dependent oxidoreductase [Spirochaetia bacterium]